MVWQADLFDVLDGADAECDGAARPALLRRSRGSPAGRARTITPDQAARVLEGSDDYRVLRRLKPRTVTDSRPLKDGERLAIVLDTETTGLDHRHDEVIELGMISFIHDAVGTVLDVVGVFSAFQEPSRPISPEITRLTGITDEMVAGQAIDIDAVETFIADADLMIAHNAAFDRPVCRQGL